MSIQVTMESSWPMDQSSVSTLPGSDFDLPGFFREFFMYCSLFCESPEDYNSGTWASRELIQVTMESS